MVFYYLQNIFTSVISFHPHIWMGLSVTDGTTEAEIGQGKELNCNESLLNPSLPHCLGISDPFY